MTGPRTDRLLLAKPWRYRLIGSTSADFFMYVDICTKEMAKLADSSIELNQEPRKPDTPLDKALAVLTFLTTGSRTMEIVVE